MYASMHNLNTTALQQLLSGDFSMLMSTRITGHTVYDACALLISSLLAGISQHIEMSSKPLKTQWF